ncbi:MAG: alcohol dehydrogenase catalytic domain-containing protein [Lentisphaerae bacterium]|mgnify:CR=1 FL=1|jgi:threonine dehydrogenase-like Zn-dependent dehydrogenase|nr:alcohol dehydrogenase catalytic domain-containing protein [Lentisphaerota bacterium]MBT5605387.1 alcohol dehydrogenase catalytic domain-containing protein [Lentisphaerota bacterium]
MKILQYMAPGQAEIQDIPVPEPGEGQVLVKVKGITTCPHWDLHLMSGEPMFPGSQLPYPYCAGQPGHEATGEIAAVGPGGEAFPVGTPVVVWRDRGHSIQGCYAQYVAVDVDHVLAIPADLAVEQIASLELAMCVQGCFSQLLRLVDLTDVRFGVGGMGPAGLVAVQLARAYGAREVVAIDPLADRREVGLQVGACCAFAPGDDGLPTRRRGPGAFDVAMDCTGLAVSVQALMNTTNQALSLFGVLRDDVRFGWEHWAGLQLLGAAPHAKEGAEKALEHVVAGNLDLRPLVTETLPLSRYTEGIGLLREKKALKICYLPWE